MFVKSSRAQILFLLLAVCVPAAAQQNSPLKSEPAGEDAPETEYRNKLRRVQENNLKVQTALTEGISAFREKNYDLAIEKFDEAIGLEPDYWGTSPVVLTNKAMVLRTVGVKKYNEAARRYWNAAVEAHPFFKDAVESLNTALRIFSETPAEIADANRASFEAYKYNTIKELAECYRLLVITDKTRNAEAINAFEEYIAVEPDEIEKERARQVLEKLRIRR